MPIVDVHNLGIAGKVYVGAAGSTPTVLLDDEQEVSMKVANTVAKRATRGKPRKSGRPSTQELSMDMTIATDTTNASFILLRTAAMTRGAVAIKALDKASGDGWDADFYVESWEESQPLDDWDGVKVSLAYSADYRELSIVDGT